MKKILLNALVLAVLLVAAAKGVSAHCGLAAALCEDEKQEGHRPGYSAWGLGFLPMIGWSGGIMGGWGEATSPASRSYWRSGFPLVGRLQVLTDLFGQIFPFGASLLVFYLVVVSFLWSLLPVIIIVFLIWWWRKGRG